MTEPTSISESAVLVELSISVWTGRKQDRHAAREIEVAKLAESGVARVYKYLLSNCTELIRIQKFTANLRKRHYQMTMPWSDFVLRLLPVAQHPKYDAEITGGRVEFIDLAGEFLDAYESAIAAAADRLGNMFAVREYPSRRALSKKFRFNLTYIPLPDAGDFRVDISKETAAQMRTHYQTYYRKQLTGAMEHLWERTHQALEKMSERLDYQGDTDKKIFRNSLVENLLEVAELLNHCNLTCDIKMLAVCNNIKRTCRGITPKALREDKNYRAAIKKQVDEIIELVKPMLPETERLAMD